MVEGNPDSPHKRRSHTPGWAGATGQRRGGHRSTNNVCGDLRVSHSVPFIRADQGLLWGSSGLQSRGEQYKVLGIDGLTGNRADRGLWAGYRVGLWRVLWGV